MILSSFLSCSGSQFAYLLQDDVKEALSQHTIPLIIHVCSLGEVVCFSVCHCVYGVMFLSLLSLGLDQSYSQKGG